MSKPNYFTESYRRRILTIVLAGAFLLVVGLSKDAPSQEGGADKDRTVRQIIRAGTEQYKNGFFEEAEKTFLLCRATRSI